MLRKVLTLAALGSSFMPTRATLTHSPRAGMERLWNTSPAYKASHRCTQGSQLHLFLLISSQAMRFLTACTAIALAALPFAAAASNITYTQFANITEPARNTSGVLVNVIAGNLKSFGELGGSSTIDWAEDSAGGE